MQPPVASSSFAPSLHLLALAPRILLGLILALCSNLHQTIMTVFGSTTGCKNSTKQTQDSTIEVDLMEADLNLFLSSPAFL
eukprot:1141487-Pelagomonas_calceolata.AAC.1